MVSGFQFMSHQKMLESTGLENFKYFTVDSNILVGISSFCYFVFYLIQKKVSKWIVVFRYLGTVSVLLTMLVTACFLAPFSKFSFFDFYQNSNLFFHFLVPLLSTISFVFFEKCDLSFKSTFTSLIPMICYAVFYMISVIPHIENGMVSYQYDFYGFLRGGAFTIVFVVPVMIFATYIIGLSVWALHKKCT